MPSRAAARLKHPQIASVFDVGEANLRIWIAGEYVESGSLADWMRRHSGQVPSRSAARFLAVLADALHYAHGQGVLHRDLKPGNVLLERVDAKGQDSADLGDYDPKLIDFGLARLDEDEPVATRTGALVGSPPYMVPEQAAGRGNEIGPTTNVYGLGAILYELLTGCPAFSGANHVQTLRRVIDEEPVAPRKLCPDLPADLEAICLRCLAKQPDRRYASAAALTEDIGRFLSGQPTLARPASSAERLLNWSHRHPAWAAFTAVSTAAVLVIIALTSLHVSRLRAANDSAERSRRSAVASAEKSNRNEQVANLYLYTSRMRLAQQAIDQGDAFQARQLLDAYAPGQPLAGLRGFEWQHLKRARQRERHTLRGHAGGVYGITFTPDGRQVVSGGEDGTIRFWDANSGSALRTIKAHTSCVNALA